MFSGKSHTISVCLCGSKDKYKIPAESLPKLKETRYLWQHTSLGLYLA